MPSKRITLPECWDRCGSNKAYCRIMLYWDRPERTGVWVSSEKLNQELSSRDAYYVGLSWSRRFREMVQWGGWEYRWASNPKTGSRFKEWRFVAS